MVDTMERTFFVVNDLKARMARAEVNIRNLTLTHPNDVERLTAKAEAIQAMLVVATELHAQVGVDKVLDELSAEVNKAYKTAEGGYKQGYGLVMDYLRCY